MTTIEFKYWGWKIAAILGMFVSAYIIWNMSNQIQIPNDEFWKSKDACKQFKKGRMVATDETSGIHPGMAFKFTCEYDASAELPLAN